jgi:hypothetical protein
MSEVVSAAAAVLAMLAVLIGGSVIALTRNVRAGMAAAVDLLLTAGLLHLTVADDWPSIAAAAAILLLRALLPFGLRFTSTFGASAQGRGPR